MPPKQKNHTVRSSNHIEEKLSSIYQDERGTLPNLRQITRKRYPLFIRAFVGLITLVALAAIGAGVFFYFFPGSSSATGDVVVIAEGPEQAAIGSPVTYTIRYRPNNKTTLQKARLQLHYPNGFMVSSTVPKASNAAESLWEWEALEKKQEGVVTVQGTLFGNPGQEQSLRVFLTYEPNQFQTEFQQVTSVNTKTLASPLQMSVEGPEHATRGKENIYTLVITNIHEEILDGLTLKLPAADNVDVRAVVNKAEGLEKDASIIETAHGLALSALKPTAQWRIPFAITFGEAAQLEKQPLHFAIQKDVRDNTFILGEHDYIITLEHNEFSMQLLINGKTEEAQVQPGEFLNVSIFYKNNGTQEVTNADIAAVLDAPSANNKSIFDWAALVELTEAPVRGEQINGDTRRGSITWNKSEIKDLAYIEAGENGVITFQLPVKNDSEILDSYDGFQAEMRTTAHVKTNNETLTINSNPVRIYLNSDTSLGAELSPKDADDNYAMTWTIENTWHPLKDVNVSTKLFGDIEWLGAASSPAGSLSFNEKTGAVDWTIGDAPLEAGTLSLTFKFKIKSSNPTQTALTSKLLLNARDTITGKDIALEHIEIPLP
ncbi:MAG TPA: hypothetical protein DDW36_00695 [Candidatus Magasanikbacteria bacterium]|nr:hypothetical protein [Candidatus Magasanikbacteria bacterium]